MLYRSLFPSSSVHHPALSSHPWLSTKETTKKKKKHAGARAFSYAAHKASSFILGDLNWKFVQVDYPEDAPTNKEACKKTPDTCLVSTTKNHKLCTNKNKNPPRLSPSSPPPPIFFWICFVVVVVESTVNMLLHCGHIQPLQIVSIIITLQNVLLIKKNTAPPPPPFFPSANLYRTATNTHPFPLQICTSWPWGQHQGREQR